jgi:hypothetical protein
VANWQIRVVLSNGETKHLQAYEGDPAQTIDRFTKQQSPYGNEWLETTDASMVARSQIVELAVVDAG